MLTITRRSITQRLSGFPGFLAAALLAASASAPAAALTSCGSVTVDAFTMKCEVLKDTTSAFHMRVGTSGHLSSAFGIFQDIPFAYYGNWFGHVNILYNYGGSFDADKVTALGYGYHVVAPHGEGLGPNFSFTLATVSPGGPIDRQTAILPHGSHFDKWGATSGYNFNGDYRFDLYASHTPEPAAWAMMVLGFGAIGVAVRRRRAGQVAA